MELLDISKLSFFQPDIPRSASKRGFRVSITQDDQPIMLMMPLCILTPFYSKVAIMLPRNDAAREVLAVEAFVREKLGRKRRLGKLLRKQYCLDGKGLRDRFRTSVRKVNASDTYMCVNRASNMLAFDRNRRLTSRSPYDHVVKIILKLDYIWISMNPDTEVVRSIGCGWELLQIGFLQHMTIHSTDHYLFRDCKDASTQTEDHSIKEVKSVPKSSPIIPKGARPLITPAMLLGIALQKGKDDEMKVEGKKDGFGISMEMLNSVKLKKTPVVKKKKKRQPSYLERIMKERFKILRGHF